MDDEQLAELECHLAAGTDLPTAFAAVQRDQPRVPVNRFWFDVGLVLGVILGAVALLWLSI